MVDFSECIIIPLSIFEQCQFRETKKSESLLQVPLNTPIKSSDILEKKATKSNILDNEELPSDIKLKLHRQEESLKKKPVILEKTIEKLEEKFLKKPEKAKESIQNDILSFTSTFPLKLQPFVQSILTKISNFPGKISWNDKLEVTIEGVLFKESNILDLLQYAMKTKVISKEADTPIGAYEFIDALLNIGVPRDWIKVGVRRSPREEAKAKKRKLPMEWEKYN